MQLPKHFFEQRRLEQLVEQRSAFTLERAELNIFETHQAVEQVYLQLDAPALVSMLQGRKHMHLREEEGFDFLPGESIIMPAHEVMCIDFPQACMDAPTRCLALTLDNEYVEDILRWVNTQYPREDGTLWSLHDYNFHFSHAPAIHQIIQRLLFLFTEDHPSKAIFADFMLRELFIRILQTEQKQRLRHPNKAVSAHPRLQYVIDFIQAHLDEPLSVDVLGKQACMSASNVYRMFKNELGCTPTAFINEARIQHALRLLKDPRRSIREISLACGFNSISYFNRVFKKTQRQTPSAYQKIYQRRPEA